MNNVTYVAYRIPIAISRKVANALLGITWEVQGAEYLEKDEAYVVVCNHQSILDFLGKE